MGRGLEAEAREGFRKIWVTASVFVNLGVLFLFKYFDFFRGSLANLLETLGVSAAYPALHWVLPLGISFYTFQSMGYVVDVYRRQVPVCKDWVVFLAFVSFFPQLVAGPIERASMLLPQFYRTLRITEEHIRDGVWLFLCGLFKKLVIADQLAPLADLAFDHSPSGFPIVFMGTVAFGMQIYCDFSGYTDMARGLALLMGYRLTMNFNLPYFAVNLRDFWSRWHISLSTWLRDYLYIPLGGNRKGPGRTRLNLMIVFLLGGLWHGAEVNFLLWGLWHGIGLAVMHAWDRRTDANFRMPDGLGRALTLAFVFYGWLLFRAQSADHLIALHEALFRWQLPFWWDYFVWNLAALCLPLLAYQVWQWKADDPMVIMRLPYGFRILVQGMMLLLIAIFWQKESTSFIYFQF